MDQSLYERRKHRWLVYGRALLTLCSLALIAGGLLLVSTQIKSIAAAEPPELDPWTKSFQGLRNAQRLNQSTENNASLIVVVDQKRRLQSVLVTNRGANNPVVDANDNNAKQRKRKHKLSKSTTSLPENSLQNEIFGLPPTYQLRHQPTKQIQLVVRPNQQQDYNQRPVAGGGGRKLCTPCKVIPHRPHRPFYQPTTSPFYIPTTSVSPSFSSSNSLQSRQRECHCNPHGSQNRSCHRSTGKCHCLPNVTGRACEQCAPGFRHLQSGHGCSACECNLTGSRHNECNPHTGQCSCHVGVGGVACDRCQDDHYGFSARGCKRCDECTNSAYVCDEHSGRCVCPPRSRGVDCQQCVANTWGWEHRRGCKECDCEHQGTFEQKCDMYTGDCSCRQGFDGRRCDRCAVGYYDYPRCQPCNCNQHGSIAAANGTLVQCDDRGQCPCRSLVTGLKCDQCRQATFDLDERNPAGCLRCFCFGRSQTCQQSDMTWGQIRSYGARNLSVEYVDDQTEEYVVVVQIKGREAEYNDAEIERKFDLHLIPSTFGNVSIGARHEFRVPLYFQLPAQYSGDLLASYGGWLNYSISTEGANRPADEFALDKHPLVQVHSHTSLVLDYFGPQIRDTSLNVTYTVGINETYWRYRFNGQNVTRAIMLTALQNVKYILIRASTWTDFTQVIVANVTMDSGYFVSGTKSNMAHSVEVCQCPDQYNGTSCQDPANGFYRWINPELTTDTQQQLVDFIGDVRPCECNDRSETCDKETGECKNCRENTGGASCDVCAEGFYGEPHYGDGCEPCPCPETNRNFARGCAMRNRKVMCICKPGYTGPLCDRCAPGFYGQPHGLTGKCESCDCDPDGTLSDECNGTTGQCVCQTGLTGRRCDRCDQSRSMLQDGHCKVCDNCTLTLLDRTDELSSMLLVGAGHLDPNGVPAPWTKLLAFENFTESISKEVGNATSAVLKLRNFDENSIDKVHSRATTLNKRHFHHNERADKRSHGAELLSTNLIKFLNDTRQTNAAIQQTIDDLNNYTEDNTVDPRSAIDEAAALLTDIRSQKTQTKDNDLTLKCARDQFAEWSNTNNILSDQRDEAISLRSNISMLHNRINIASVLADKSRGTSAEALNLLHKNQAEFKGLLANEDLVLRLVSTTHDDLNNNLASKMNVLTDQYHDSSQKVRQAVRSINSITDLVREANAKCSVELDEIRQELMPRVKLYQEELTSRAEEYADLFKNTKDGAEVALRASSSHRNIVEAIDDAQKSAQQAIQAVAKSQDELFDENNSDNVIEKSLSSVDISKDIEDMAKDEFQKLEELNESLNGHQKVVYDINTTIWQTGVENNKLSNELSSLNNNATRKSLLDHVDQAVKVSDQMRKVHREANDISSDVFKLKSKLNALEPQWDSQFGGAQENVSQTEGNIIAANRTLNRLEDIQANNTEHFVRWNSSMSSSMQALRDKISQARHAAESIRVSMRQTKETHHCIRSYVPTVLGLTTANTIKMSVAVSNPDGNGPLLYIQGEGRAFIALEMVKRKVHLVWNLGGDTGSLTHPTELRSRDLKLNEAWYQIEVNRTMNLASMTIGQVDSQGIVITKRSVSGATQQDRTRFSLTIANRIWIGGVPPGIPHDELLQSDQPIAAVVHKLQIDDEQIGLWNFAHSQGSCGGAILGAHEATTGSGTWHFNGMGYATVKRSRSTVSKNRFSMQLIFKTFDENALLFLAVDENSNRSVSLTLHEGRLLFRIDYGNESKLEINTTHRYNFGNWTKVGVARHFMSGTENALLTIPNSEEKSGSPNHPITSRDLPNLSRAVYHLGGVPPGFKSGTTKAPGADHAYLGCMKDIQVNGDAYDPLDSSANYGVEINCRDTINVAGFYGTGFVELPAHSLRKRANFGLVMRTLQPECLIMLSTSEETSSNYSVSLIEGRPQLWLHTSASNPVRLSANVSLNDGEYHVIGLQKTGCRVELRVDDRLMDTGRLDSHGCALNVGNGGRLFMGGAPKDMEQFNEISPTFVRFAGAIKDVVFNNGTVVFNGQVGFNQVQLGRSGPKMGSNPLNNHANLLEPIGTSFAAVPEGCHRVGSYSYEPDAFKFGDVLHSHSIVGPATRQLWQKNFSVLFDFRTFYPNGVLFLAPGTKEKQKHFIGLMLKDGQLMLILRGRKKEEHTIPLMVNDGQWHSVSLTSIKKALTIRVGLAGPKGIRGKAVVSHVQLPKRMNAANIMFIGGISETAGGSLPGELFSKLEQFKGCIRKFQINNATQDLARPGRHFNVGQCFPTVEKGSYFPGDAYVIYKKNFNVGNYLELQFEFRTSELNGVLLSVAEPTGFPALSIEIFGGMIVMSCDLGDGNPIRVETASIALPKFSLCDNRWHNISAMYDSEQLALRIDHHPSIVVFDQRRIGGKVNTKSPLYIGGLADTAPSGTLLSRENFKGCIRNVLIRNELRDWTDMDELHNVLLSECLAIN